MAENCWHQCDQFYRKRKFCVIGAIVVVVTAVVGGVVAAVVPSRKPAEERLDRLECPGLKDENSCTQKGCLWNAVKQGPYCCLPPKHYSYKVSSVSATDKGVTAVLQSSSDFNLYGDPFRQVKFQVEYLTDKILRFKLTTDSKRYEVPEEIYNRDFPGKPDPTNVKYKVSHTTYNEPFYFEILRKDTGTPLWNTKIGGLVLSDQFLQIATYLPSKNIYGFGESTHRTLRHDLNYRTWPLFARDQPPLDGDLNLYGVHPFYTCLEDDGKSHGVLLLNSNAMEYTLMPAPALSYRTIGGVLDFFMFVGDDPEDVIKLYTEVIGRTMLPPFWSLGFQLCRYGYSDLGHLQSVVDRTRQAEIPQDVQYADIDYMDGRKDFTVDAKLFGGLGEYIEKTKKENGLRWVVILDPAIEAVENYAPYQTGVEEGVFIKWGANVNGSIYPKGVDLKSGILYGKVWPSGLVAFPDFFLNKTQEWWIRQITDFYKGVKFDGLWIDMNEPANFGTNEDFPFYCKPGASPEECWSLKCPPSKYDDPPYNTAAAWKHGEGKRLSDNTICLDTVQGPQRYSHYDVHSLYGWSQTQPTLRAVEKCTNGRGLVISRSTYPSSGRHSGHWLGDNRSSWRDMRESIIGMLEFNLFGIPYIGADICGFMDNTTVELCKRWMQLGAFYPYCRNHNGEESPDQDPVALGDDVASASRTALRRRYTLLPYLYTLFYKAHTEGSTVVRPVFHEYPTDSKTWDIDSQFMWGPAFLVSPVLHEGQTKVEAYLPNDTWYRYKQYKSDLETAAPGFTSISDIDETPLHVRGGYIIPVHGPGMNTKQSRATGFHLLVFPKGKDAKGELFWDDGESIDTVRNKNYFFCNFELQGCQLKIKDTFGDIQNKDEVTLKDVTVFNMGETTKVSFVIEGSSPSNVDIIPSEKRTLRFKVNKPLQDMTITWQDNSNNCNLGS